MARDFFRCGHLLRRQVVEAEHHERVGVGQNPLVDGQRVASLVNALEDGDWVAGSFAGNLLKAERGAMEQLQRAGDPLEKLRGAIFRRFVVRPEHVADFGHGGEAVFHRRGITACLPRIAPSPVNAHPPFAGSVFAGHMILIVCARRLLDGAHG